MSTNNTTSGAEGAGESVGQGVKGLVNQQSSPPTMLPPPSLANANAAAAAPPPLPPRSLSQSTSTHTVVSAPAAPSVVAGHHHPAAGCTSYSGSGPATVMDASQTRSGESDAAAPSSAQSMKLAGSADCAGGAAHATRAHSSPPHHEQHAECGKGGGSGSSGEGIKSHSEEEQTTFTSRGRKLGAAVAGIFQGVHGAGEVIRGNINSFLDKAGEGVTGNKVATADKHSSDYDQGGHDSVAKKGEDSVKEGLANVQGSTK